MHTSRITELSNFPNRKKTFLAATLLVSGIIQSCKNAESATEMPPVAPTSTSYLSTYPQPIRHRADEKYALGYTVGCKDWMVRVPNSPSDFCIDRFEAMVVEIQNGKEVSHFPTVHPKKGTKLIAKVSPDFFPQSSVNRFQAEESCHSAGKRLCTMNEWKRACMGVQQFKFSYGNEELSGKCNTRRKHFLTESYGKDSKKWNMNDPTINLFAGLEKPGTRAECVSSFGVFDMVGNLQEWVSDLVDKSLVANTPYIGKAKRGNTQLRSAVGNGIFMGGFFSSANQNGDGCNYATIAHLPDHYDYSIGFRCCSETGSD